MQHALQEKVTEYQQLQRELEKLNISRRKIIAQISENEMVNQELLLLTADSKVYKLIGPTLIKQESGAAQGNVAKRLEYLNAEALRLDQCAKDTEKQIGAKKEAVSYADANANANASSTKKVI